MSHFNFSVDTYHVGSVSPLPLVGISVKESDCMTRDKRAVVADEATKRLFLIERIKDANAVVERIGGSEKRRNQT